MQTAFSAEQLSVPAIAAADGILRACVHYGFCTAVCPTYVLTRDENESPRGRIDLIRAMLERGGPPPASTVAHIDQCLSCNACMTTCAVKVDYLRLIDIARARIEKTYRRPLGDRLLRRLVAATIPDPSRFRRAAALARLARPLRRLLPARLGNLVGLVPRRAVPAGTIRCPGTYRPHRPPRLRVALLSGCVQQALAPHINDATIRLLTRLGCEVVVAPGVDCCGALTLHMGKEELARTAARGCIEAWTREIEGEGLDAVVVNTSGCGTTVKEYGRLFDGDGALAEPAAAIGSLAADIVEVVQRLGLPRPDRRVPLAVAYHDACSLQHAQKITTPPRALLRAAGFRVHDVPEAHFCCGSAGTYNLLQPAMAEQLGRRKASRIESTGAAAVAAGNLGCLVQIGRYTGLPAVHTVELLDWATGGPLPPALADTALPAAEPWPAEAAPAPAVAAPPPAEGGGPGIW